LRDRCPSSHPGPLGPHLPTASLPRFLCLIPGEQRGTGAMRRLSPLSELTGAGSSGLLRRVALEAGRRLVTLGLLERAEEAAMLTADELHEALRTRLDVRRIVSRRKAEHAWVRANPRPMTSGPEPGQAPDLRGLPAPARRINRALLWINGARAHRAAQGEGERDPGQRRVVRRLPWAGPSDSIGRPAAHAARG
jgi:hypothetical protein